MARRSPPPAPQQTSLSVDQMRGGIARLKKRIQELEQFDPATVQKRWSTEVKQLETAIEGTLAAVFGHGSVEYNRYSNATSLDHGPVMMMGFGDHREDPREAQQYVADGKTDAIATLSEAVRWLQEEIEARTQGSTSAPPSTPVAQTNNRRIFVVHGHDEAARETVARFLEKIDLQPIVLHEQVSRSQTIIEKIETYGDVGFAVVLLTPDDVGGQGSALRPRARQNVIFELGYFIGRLGRARVCALKKGDPEVLSDVAGVVYTAMDIAGAWKVTLAKEIDAAGINVDFNKVMRG